VKFAKVKIEINSGRRDMREDNRRFGKDDDRWEVIKNIARSNF